MPKPELPDTVHVVDHTKIKAFCSCPRRYFYEYICGWRPDQDEHALIYGQAFHVALEYLYDKQKERDSLSLEKRDAEEAWLMFLAHYREYYPEETDMDYAPKDPANTAKALDEYVALYGVTDRYEVIYSEISGAVPINSTGRLVYFRLDTVLREPMNGTYMVLEHKTSKWSKYLWEASMAISMQGGVGVHVLSCLYPPDKVKGLVYNGVFLFKKGNEFARVPYMRSDASMQDWLVTINHYVDSMERELGILMEHDKEDAPCMHAFPKNPNSCVSYNRPCPYLDFCRGWANPLKHIQQEPPADFHKKYWDPREQDKEWHAPSAKVVTPEEALTVKEGKSSE